MDLKELENGVQPDIHWYYQSKKMPLLRYVRRLLETEQQLTIVDVGSGSGFFALELEKTFPERIGKVYLVDINYTPDEIAATTGAKIEKVLAIPPKMDKCLVVLMDVLEHLEDDLQMLASIKQACAGGVNYFFITVPAFQSLWSGHDVFLGHYRRYKIATLRMVLRQAAFSRMRLFYLYGSLYPMVWITRQMDNLRKAPATSNMKPLNKMLNGTLLAVAGIDMRLSRWNKLFGVSCCAEGKI